MEKAVTLGNPGEPPPWGQGGGATAKDADIAAAKDWPQDEQRKLFFGLARHLYDLRVRDNVEERYDHSDDDQWLADLAAWFGWSDELRDEVKKEAMRAAAVILPHEMPGAG
jgi:hypothetical protein